MGFCTEEVRSLDFGVRERKPGACYVLPLFQRQIALGELCIQQLRVRDFPYVNNSLQLDGCWRLFPLNPYKFGRRTRPQVITQRIREISGFGLH